MTRVDINFFAEAALRDSNLDHNDYAYYSGWNPSIALGQQFMVGATEAKELVYEINQDGWLREPMLGLSRTDLRGAILSELYKISTPEAAKEMSKGSVRVTRAAADILNAYAQELGVDVKFVSHNQRPNHPVG